MMSKSSYLTDRKAPRLALTRCSTKQRKTVQPWGANLTNSPVLAVNYWCFSP